MRIVTYNLNSLPARLPRVLALLDEHDIDVALLQETKTTADAFPHMELQLGGYVAVEHSSGPRNGVAILVRDGLEVTDVARGLPGEPDPEEARWVEATVDGVRMASVYVPNGQKIGAEQFGQKLDFLDRMAEQATAMSAAGPAVIGGDMNVCPTDLDAYDPAALHGGTHATDDERSRWTAIRDSGYVDAFRHLHAEDDPGYTWWDYRAGHFHKGFGLRIDHVFVSEDLAGRITAAGIDRDYRKPTKVPESKPSDHAPLMVDLTGLSG